MHYPIERVADKPDPSAANVAEILRIRSGRVPGSRAKSV